MPSIKRENYYNKVVKRIKFCIKNDIQAETALNKFLNAYNKAITNN